MLCHLMPSRTIRPRPLSRSSLSLACCAGSGSLSRAGAMAGPEPDARGHSSSEKGVAGSATCAYCTVSSLCTSFFETLRQATCRSPTRRRVRDKPLRSAHRCRSRRNAHRARWTTKRSVRWRTPAYTALSTPAYRHQHRLRLGFAFWL